MNVFLREINSYRKSMLIWAASLAGIVLLFMTMYPAFSQDVDAIRKVMESLPAAVRAALGVEFDTFFSVLGFYGYLLGFAILTASIQAMNMGVGVLSKEIAGKTVDFLLSKPITRGRVVTEKIAAALTAIVFTSAVFAATSFFAVTAAAKKDFSVGTLMLMASTMFLVQLMFLALGVLFSVIIPKVKSVVSVSLPTVFAFYIIGTISDLVENDSLRFASPFRYFDLNYILRNDRLEPKFLAIEAAIVVAAIAASYVIYIRKDIRAAV